MEAAASDEEDPEEEDEIVSEAVEKNLDSAANIVGKTTGKKDFLYFEQKLINKLSLVQN